MKSSQEIKELFAQLPISSQRQLLDELLQEQELQGKILTDAQEKEKETLSALHEQECI
jgi:hypothetical protein